MTFPGPPGGGFSSLIVFAPRPVTEYAAIVEEAFQPWPDNPAAMIADLWPDLVLRDWETRALQQLRSGWKRHAWRTARGAGKTWFVALLAWWWAFTRCDRGLVAYVTASHGQAKIFWEELTKFWHWSPRLRALCPGWEILDRRVVDETGRTVIVALSAGTGENLEGFHALSMLVLGDEAKAIPDDTFRSTRGWLAGAAELVEIFGSVPGRGSGFFWRLFADERFRPLHVPARDVPELAEWEADMRASYDERDPIIRTQVDAEFAGDADDYAGLLPLSLIEAAVGRKVEPDGTRWRRVLGVDPAGGGSNEFAVALRRGPNIEEIIAWRGEADQKRNVERVLSIAARFEAEAIVVDRTGLGDGIYSRIDEAATEARRYGGILRAVPFTAALAPEDDKIHQNLKTSLWYRVRAAQFESGKIGLPDDRRLVAQLGALTVTYDVKGRARVVDPSPSPDRADAVLLSFADDLYVVPFFTGTPEWMR